MTTVKLNYTVDFGGEEYGDWCEWELDLTEKEEAVYLAAVAQNCDRNTCEDLEPILSRAAEEILEQERQNMEEMYGEDTPDESHWCVIVEFAEDA